MTEPFATDFFALLDNNYQADGQSFLFTDPVDWITCETLDQADDCLGRIEAAEHFAVGYIAYEFGQHFGYFSKPDAGGMPLLQFGIFRKRESLTRDEVDAWLAARFQDDAPMIAGVNAKTTPDQYADAIAKIKAELEAGNSYQVNYTFETAMQLGGCPYRLYDALRRAQPVRYGAFLNLPSGQIFSRSPELFFEKRGRQITCKPMKGTEPRGADPQTDHEHMAHLIASPKQRAENLMIVDLLRNDMSRIAELGSVQVERLYEVETYQTVHQMTSTITASLTTDALAEILEALFPCGSITGAPKLITTRLIDELEPHARGVYCGAIGVVEPNADMIFNVPIRTLVAQNHIAKFHIGGGVVYDSVQTKEYDEALLKGKFLFDLPSDFRLIDSHYFAPNSGARHLERHLERLKLSAQNLRFAYDAQAIKKALDALYDCTNYEAKIRVELSQSGAVMVEAEPLLDFEGEKIVALSDQRMHSADPNLAHKTTNRALYNSAFKAARANGHYDVIFANEHGYLTEGAIHNLVLRFGDEFVTPPLSAGVLAGVGRAVFLAENPNTRVENIPIDSLRDADEILLVSSVRGVVPVALR